MKRKSASIIGRIVGLILVVALAFGITWCATNWSTVKAEISELWNKITGNEQTQPEDPTPVDPTPHEHLWSEWVTTLAPTCFDKGTQTRTCDCGETETQTLPAPGHDYGEDGICINCGFDLNTCNHKNGLSGGYCDECGELVRARHWILNETLNCDVDEPISCDIAFLSWQGSFTKLTVEPGLIRYDEWSPYNSISQNGWPVFDILGPRCLVFEFTPTGEIRDWLDANGTSCSGDSEYCDYLNPTCDCDGYRRVLCSECGIADIFQAAPALGGEHEFVDHVCSRCGAVEAPVITLNDNLLTIEDYTQSLSYCLAGRVYNSYDGGGIHVFSSPILDIASMDYSFYGNCLDPIYISVEAFYWSDDF